MITRGLAVGPFQANCYLLGCQETREALVIDPGGEPDRIEEEITRHGLKPVAYLHTHGHVDHVGATATLKQRLGGEILIHRADLFLYERAPEQSQSFGIRLPDMAPVDRFLEEEEPVTWGKARASVIHTPGHSPGGICLQVPGALMARETEAANPGAHKPQETRPDWVFTGDTLFNGSIGRTDLPGGSFEELMTSIKESLLGLPDATVLAPGHGPLSTVGEEKRINPFILELR